MKNYHIKFYMGTDLRTDWKGQAYTEIHALALALTAINEREWVDVSHAKIIIELV